MRRILLIGAGIFGGLLIGFWAVSIMKPKQSLEKQLVEGNDLVIENPRFVGHSPSNGKITIVGTRAMRAIDKSSSTVTIENPDVSSDMGAELTATEGKWNQQTQELILSGNVVYKNKNGDNATSEKAYWSIRDPRTNDLAAPIDTKKPFNVTGQVLVWLVGNAKLSRKSGENLHSDVLIWNDKTQVANAEGNAIFTTDKNKVTAAKIRVERLAQKAFASGNVVISGEKFEAHSQEFEYDHKTKDAVGSGGVTVISEGSSAKAATYIYNTDTKRTILKGGVTSVIRREN